MLYAYTRSMPLLCVSGLCTSLVSSSRQKVYRTSPWDYKSAAARIRNTQKQKTQAFINIQKCRILWVEKAKCQDIKGSHGVDMANRHLRAVPASQPALISSSPATINKENLFFSISCSSSIPGRELTRPHHIVSSSKVTTTRAKTSSPRRVRRVPVTSSHWYLYTPRY